jgi:CheY-like chemotaxis protein
MAAADAILRIPGPPPPATARVVEVLRRALASAETPKVLIADNNQDRAEAVAKAVQEAGFEPLVAPTGRDALQRLSRAADVDVLLIDAEVPDPPLAPLLSQLRSDVNAGLLPVLITANSERLQSLERLVHRYKNVWLISAALDAKVLKQTFATRIGQTAGQPLSEVERKDNASRAIEWLARLGRGEVVGYDIRPAQGAILEALRSNELAPLAVEAAGRLPGREPQRALANVVLSETAPEPLRSAAAIELCRHIQQHGLVLNAQQIKAIESLFDTASDAKLKANISLVLGSMRPDARLTGERLQRYVPAFSVPAKPESSAAEPKERKDTTPPGE